MVTFQPRPEGGEITQAVSVSIYVMPMGSVRDTGKPSRGKKAYFLAHGLGVSLRYPYRVVQ